MLKTLLPFGAPKFLPELLKFAIVQYTPDLEHVVDALEHALHLVERDAPRVVHVVQTEAPPQAVIRQPRPHQVNRLLKLLEVQKAIVISVQHTDNNGIYEYFMSEICT